MFTSIKTKYDDLIINTDQITCISLPFEYIKFSDGITIDVYKEDILKLLDKIGFSITEDE